MIQRRRLFFGPRGVLRRFEPKNVENWGQEQIGKEVATNAASTTPNAAVWKLTKIESDTSSRW